MPQLDLGSTALPSAAQAHEATAEQAAASAMTTEPNGKTEKMTVGQMVLAGLGFMCFGIGVVGIFVPLLPTTDFILIATFLFMKSSPRFHNWILQTKVYNDYVRPFKEKGGMTKKAKAKMLISSLSVLAISAAFVRIWYAWIILAIVAAGLLYLILVRTPTRLED